MKLNALVLGILLILTACQNSENKGVDKTTGPAELSDQTKPPSLERVVENNVIISPQVPTVKIKVDDGFRYIGKFDFEILAASDEYPAEMQGKAVAAGERLVFVKSDSSNAIEKLFIVQFEGFLSNNDFKYNYNFDNAEKIGENKYRYNTWFYDARQSANDNPIGEGAKTIQFLESKGYSVEDHWMMSRYVGLASEDRKNEIIIFYQEMLKKSTGYTLEEWENEVSEEESAKIKSNFVERSKKSFTII